MWTPDFYYMKLESISVESSTACLSLFCRDREREWSGDETSASARRASTSGRQLSGEGGAPGGSPVRNASQRNNGSPSSNGASAQFYSGTEHYGRSNAEHFGRSGSATWPGGGGGNGTGGGSGSGGGEHAVARVGLQTRTPSMRRDADGMRCGLTDTYSTVVRLAAGHQYQESGRCLQLVCIICRRRVVAACSVYLSLYFRYSSVPGHSWRRCLMARICHGRPAFGSLC